jgi:hypothetical protein
MALYYIKFENGKTNRPVSFPSDYEAKVFLHWDVSLGKPDKIMKCDPHGQDDCIHTFSPDSAIFTTLLSGDINIKID